MGEVVFLKLGGSLITDKQQPLTARQDVIRRLATEIARAVREQPELRLVVGHGSGSFGHTTAERYKTREGVHGLESWRGFAEVATTAARLNCLVTATLREADVPVFRVQPSASAQCEDGQIVTMALEPIWQALANRLVPLVYGDVAIDVARGGTIISTEDIFVYLAGHLRPRRILLAGDKAGVHDSNGKVIPEITPGTFDAYRTMLSGSEAVDVTGGMLSKVEAMVELCRETRELEVRIFSGAEAGAVERLLAEPEWEIGTQIVSK